LFVHPAMHDGWGTVIMEAAARGGERTSEPTIITFASVVETANGRLQ